MTKEEMDYIGAMNMCDEISNEAYKKIMCHCEESEPCEDCISRAEAEKWLKAGCANEIYNLPSVHPTDALTNLLNDLNDLFNKYGYDMAAWSTCEHDPGALKSEFDLSIFCDKKEAHE